MMIITCPRCTSHYQIDPGILGDHGRAVRCSNCGHSWTQPPISDPAVGIPVARPEPRRTLERMLQATGTAGEAMPAPALAPSNLGTPAAQQPAPQRVTRAETANQAPVAPVRTVPEADRDVSAVRPTAERRSDPAADGRGTADADRLDSGAVDADADAFDPGSGGEPEAAAALTVEEARLAYVPPPPPRRKVPWGLIGTISASVVAIAAVVLYLGRAAIVDAVPGMAPLYAAFGIEAHVLGEGLDIRDIEATRTQVATGEAIMITGLVENVDTVPRPVPPVRVTLFDPDDEALRHTIVAVTDQPLDVGATAAFTATVVNPPVMARRITVTFAPADAVADESAGLDGHNRSGSPSTGDH